MAVGMTHAALYAYFPSKAALYLATTEHAQSLLQPDYLAAIERGGSFKEQLREILMVSAAAHGSDSSITGLLAAIPPALDKLLVAHEALKTPESQVTLAKVEVFFARAKELQAIANSLES